MAIPFYRWFPGDYARDTRHLSLMQHGVYRLLIDLYMDQGRPLRNDLPYLYRWLHAESVEEKNAVEFVLGEFFMLKANSWMHKRCEEELQWREMKAESARGSAVKRWHSERNANAMRTQCDGNAIKNQNQNQNQIKEKSKPIGSRKSKTGRDPVFVFPEWLAPNRDVWDAWLEARSKSKKPATGWAKSLAVAKLERMQEQGYNVRRILADAAFHNWQSFYPPKETTA